MNTTMYTEKIIIDEKGNLNVLKYGKLIELRCYLHAGNRNILGACNIYCPLFGEVFYLGDNRRIRYELNLCHCTISSSLFAFVPNPGWSLPRRPSADEPMDRDTLQRDEE